MARDLGDTGVDADREFEFVVSYDRNMVTAAAHSLVGRLTANRQRRITHLGKHFGGCVAPLR
ncbi:hypothetical protein [Dactylosporangium sp. NPDC005555]|uniref:hypothetical protein n=1 Tax=Dactylosporangium sp. NPDC005555 TaxID=3154889 RepID=UPI0033A25C67